MTRGRSTLRVVYTGPQSSTPPRKLQACSWVTAQHSKQKHLLNCQYRHTLVHTSPPHAHFITTDLLPLSFSIWINVLGKTTTAVIITQKPIVFLKSDSRKVNFVQSFIGIIYRFYRLCAKDAFTYRQPKKGH